MLCNRYGHRIVAVIGSLVTVLGFIFTGYVDSLYWTYFTDAIMKSKYLSYRSHCMPGHLIYHRVLFSHFLQFSFSSSPRSDVMLFYLLNMISNYKRYPLSYRLISSGNRFPTVKNRLFLIKIILSALSAVLQCDVG